MLNNQIVKQKDSEARERESPLQSLQALVRIKRFYDLIDRFAFHYGLKGKGLSTFIDLCCAWEFEHRGLSLQELCNLHVKTRSGEASDYYVTMRGRVDELVAKGLVEVIGRTKSNAKYYAPTAKALKEFGYVVQSVA